ncbi:MAG: HRDC domain-containing protein [Anaerolineaceae bacterium]
MTNPDITLPTYVDTPALLEQMLRELRQSPALAIDTESNSLHAYQEQVCLIQISTREQDYLVDSLALPDLSALGGVFADANTQKVFHAGDYDLTCLKRDYAFQFANVFDTMLAASALGEESLGLAGLLEKYLDVHIDKKYQRADWGKRPIKAEMLRYAQMDSHYLLALRDVLTPQLAKLQRLAIVLEDSAALASQTPAMKNHSEDFWRVKGINGMKPPALSLLKQLNHLRENLAKSQNLPPFKILSDAALVEIANTQPHYIEELNLLPSLSVGQVRRYGKELMRIVEQWRKAPGKVSKPRSQAPSDAVLRRREILGEWRKQSGLKQGLPSNVILPRDLLEKIAQAELKDLDALRGLMLGSPSRFEMYGEAIFELLREEQI